MQTLLDKIQLPITFKILAMVIRIKGGLTLQQTKIQITMDKAQAPFKINFQTQMEVMIRMEAIQLHFQAKME